jgi:hypothetical protein
LAETAGSLPHAELVGEWDPPRFQESTAVADQTDDDPAIVQQIRELIWDGQSITDIIESGRLHNSLPYRIPVVLNGKLDRVTVRREAEAYEGKTPRQPAERESSQSDQLDRHD